MYVENPSAVKAHTQTRGSRHNEMNETSSLASLAHKKITNRFESAKRTQSDFKTIDFATSSHKHSAAHAHMLAGQSQLDASCLFDFSLGSAAALFVTWKMRGCLLSMHSLAHTECGLCAQQTTYRNSYKKQH